MLHTTVKHLEAGDDWSELEELSEELLDWGDEYSVHDLGGLYKKYSDIPTAFPDVNFAMNARLLYLDGYVVEEISNHAFSEARNELTRVVKWVESEESVEAPVRVTYQRLTSTLEGILVKAKCSDSAEDCQNLGKACVPVVSEMSSYQRRFSR